MNELNTKIDDLDCSPDVALADFNRLLTSGLPRKELAPLVRQRVRLAITQFAQRASISTSSDDVLAAANEVCSRHGALAIPLPPELCTLMARVGFDKALFTYGNADGVAVGFAEAMWLLNFVEVTEQEPSRHREESWLQAYARHGAGRSNLATTST